MKNNEFSEQFLQESLEIDSWARLSEDSDFAWNENLLEKYKDKVDWDKISANSGILWTQSMLEKFYRKINWKELSGSDNKNLFSTPNLKKYADNWNWQEISKNSDIEWTLEKIEELKEFIDWKEFINKHSLWCRREKSSYYSFDFFEKFREYIPATRIKDSALWDNLVEEKARKLAERLTGEKL